MITVEQHARLGPSNHRWPHCPGSVREEKDYPDIPGDSAIDGTGSHLLLNQCLKNPSVPIESYDQHIIGENHPDNPNGWLVDPKRIERVKMALNYIDRRIKELKQQFDDCDVLVLSESKADPGGAFGRDDWWGTCDITLIARHKMTTEVFFVEVIDYKDGREFVPVKWNTQLLSYLFGKLRDFIATGPQKVRPFRTQMPIGCRMTIVQPKTNPVVRYQCSTSLEDDFNLITVVDKVVDELAVAATATDDPNAPLISGKHCRWCKANPKRGGHCTVEANQSLQVVTNMSNEIATTGSLFEQIQGAMADPKSLTEEQLADLADAEAGIMAIFDKVKTEIEERLNQGIMVPGYAMEPGNGKNVWNAEEKIIVKKLKACRLKTADIYPPTMISPAQMKKLDKLTTEQKERLWNELVSYIASSTKTLKKVSREVAQSNTTGLQSVEMMFGSVAPAPQQEDQNQAQAPAEVSFM